MQGLWGMGQMIPLCGTQYLVVADDDVNMHDTSEALFTVRNEVAAHPFPPAPDLGHNPKAFGVVSVSERAPKVAPSGAESL